MTEVLTPTHKSWPTFRKRLDAAVYTSANGKLLNVCQGDLSLSIEILRSLPEIDLDETLIFLKEYGGNCDCKVIMNVARIWNNR